ncbi:MAG: MBL fold metallo-hydrolase, partial [Thermomicrobiales bacterium]
MTLTVQAFPGGTLATNTYLVADSTSREAIIVDAADGTLSAVSSALDQNNLVAKAIVLTHTHWDHVVDATAMRRTLQVPLHVNAFAQTLFGGPDAPIAIPELPDIESFLPDRKLDEADEITVGEYRFTVLFVPGHERAHIALWCEAEDVLISGDVIFPGGHGTTE